MKKLTKHKSFESLKLSGQSNATTDNKVSKPIQEVEDFLHQLRQARPKDLNDIKQLQAKRKEE